MAVDDGRVAAGPRRGVLKKLAVSLQRQEAQARAPTRACQSGERLEMAAAGIGAYVAELKP
jgi:hypothetical protein